MGQVFLTVWAYQRLPGHRFFILANVGDVVVYAVHAVFSDLPAFSRLLGCPPAVPCRPVDHTPVSRYTCSERFPLSTTIA